MIQVNSKYKQDPIDLVSASTGSHETAFPYLDADRSDSLHSNIIFYVPLGHLKFRVDIGQMNRWKTDMQPRVQDLSSIHPPRAHFFKSPEIFLDPELWSAWSGSKKRQNYAWKRGSSPLTTEIQPFWEMQVIRREPGCEDVCRRDKILLASLVTEILRLCISHSTKKCLLVQLTQSITWNHLVKCWKLVEKPNL